jgi:uncharacterized protein
MQGRWKASRFTARTTESDGTLILYNSATGAIVGIPPAAIPLVRPATNRDAITLGPLKGIFAQLAQGGFLVPEETEEDEVLQTLIDRRIHSSRSLHLILLPTEDCNFRCVYCYESFKRGQMRRSVQESVAQWFEQNAHRFDEVFVEWFGGEPLYASNVVLSLGQRLYNTACKYGLRHYSAMTTNGYYREGPESPRSLVGG